jgi:hypothetical protein
MNKRQRKNSAEKALELKKVKTKEERLFNLALTVIANINAGTTLKLK